MVQVTRFLTTISFLLAASSTVSAAVAPRDDACIPGAEICGRSNFKARAALPLRPYEAPAKRITNAERLARGLPLMKPARRFQPTRVSRTQPSGLASTYYHGVIQVIRDSDSATLGYISKNSLSTHQLGYQPDLGNALIVDFSTPGGATVASQVEISTENQDTGFNLLSLVQGGDDADGTIQPGSFQYGYISGSAHTDPGATPQSVPNAYYVPGRLAESSVWTFDSTSNALAPQWINPDGSSPTTLNFVQSTGLYFGGDSDAFQSKYSAPVDRVHYVFVPV